MRDLIGYGIEQYEALFAQALMSQLELNFHSPFSFFQTKHPFRSSHVTRDVTQKLTCYDLSDGQGDSVILVDYAPYLANYQFDNRASFCCLDGM